VNIDLSQDEHQDNLYVHVVHICHFLFFTVYWWVRNKKIAYAKIGKNVLISEKVLLRFLENNTIRPIDEEDFIIPERIK